jgi:hypothetical protein
VIGYFAGAGLGAVAVLVLEIWRDHHRTPFGDRRAVGWLIGLALLDVMVVAAVAFAALKGLDLEARTFLGPFGRGFSVGALGLLALRAPVWNVDVRPDVKAGITVIYDMARYELEKEFEERMKGLADRAREKLMGQLKDGWDSDALRGAIERHVAEISRRSFPEASKISERAAAASTGATEEGRVDALLKVALDFRLTSLVDRVKANPPSPEDSARGRAAKQVDAKNAAIELDRAERTAAEAEGRL